MNRLIVPVFRRWPAVRFGLVATLVFVAALAGGAELLLACPTCKDGLAQNDPNAANLVQGYFWSILFMMSMPFLILAGLGSYFYWEVCKARRLRDRAAGLTLEQGKPT